MAGRDPVVQFCTNVSMGVLTARKEPPVACCAVLYCCCSCCCYAAGVNGIVGVVVGGKRAKLEKSRKSMSFYKRSREKVAAWRGEVTLARAEAMLQLFVIWRASEE